MTFSEPITDEGKEGFAKMGLDPRYSKWRRLSSVNLSEKEKE